MVTYLNTPQIFGILSREQNTRLHLWKSQDQRTEKGRRSLPCNSRLLGSGGVSPTVPRFAWLPLRPGAAQVPVR